MNIYGVILKYFTIFAYSGNSYALLYTDITKIQYHFVYCLKVYNNCA